MDNLLKLHRVDAQVRGLRARLESARRYLEAQTRQHAAVAARLDELKARTRARKAKIANLEVEGAVLDEQLEKFRRDLNNAVNSKQYQAVHLELSNVKQARSKLDDAILAEMGEVERTEGEIAEAEAQVAERARVRDAAAAQLQEREQEVGARLSELETERGQAAALVPGDALAVFEEMADVHGGDAMATVLEIDRRHREYACGECNMHLPFELVATLMAPSGTLVRCNACGRILYMQDELRGSLTPK